MTLENLFNSNKPILLDGGNGQEIIKRIPKIDNTLWSTNALLHDPQIVQDVHEDYIKSGSDIITTDTYTTYKSRLKRENMEDRFVEINQIAGQVARKAQQNAKASGREVFVAASLPPLWGSYRPELVGTEEEAKKLYCEWIEILDPFVDFYLAETFTSVSETVGVAQAVASTGKPLWVAWTLRDEPTSVLRSGVDIVEMIKEISNQPISAYLINCCIPESISVALPKMAELIKSDVFKNKLLGAYANGFVSIPEKWKYVNPDSLPGSRQDLSPESYLNFVKDWLNFGARIVGGCCEIGPAHIQMIRSYLDNQYQ